MDPGFEQLSNDTDLISRIKQFRDATNNIGDALKLVDNETLYERLSNADKIKYNLLMSFGMNTLFWMYLRAEGIDPSTHQIKMENERLKQSMTRAQEIKDRKTIMPRLNKNVAQRFIKSGLWTPGHYLPTNANVQELCHAQQIDENEEDWDSSSPPPVGEVHQQPQLAMRPPN